MLVKVFNARNKRRAVRKAIDFWYKELRDDHRLLDFLNMCKWKKIEEAVFMVTYRGPEPK